MLSRMFYRWVNGMSTYYNYACAFVLIFASALKALALLTIDQPGRNFWYSRFFLSFIAAMEMFLGIGLLLRFYPKWTVNAARAVFIVFFQFALYLALTGEKICPCLGVLALPPWVIVVFDSFILAGLLSCDSYAIPPRTMRTHPRDIALAFMLYLQLSLPFLLAANRHSSEEIKNYAGQDDRLRAYMSVSFKQAQLQEILDRISTITGITLKMGPLVAESQQGFSRHYLRNLNLRNIPAWVLMEYVARTSGKFRWTKVDNEYHLVPLPWWQRVNPWYVFFGLLLLEGPCCYFILRPYLNKSVGLGHENYQVLKRVAISGGAFFLVACFAYTVWRRAALHAVPARKAPTLECAEPVFDFGAVETGDSIEHVFTLRNYGAEPLTILGARPDCGCSTVQLPEKTIVPGQSMPVSVQLSLKNMRGPVEKRVLIISDDPDRPNYFLVLKGTARSAIQIYPLAVNFGSLKADAEATQLVEIKPSATGGAFQVKKVWADSKYFAITHEVLPEKKGYRIFVKTKPPLPKGPLRTVLRVQTDLPKEAEIIIPVSVMIEETLTSSAVKQNEPPRSQAKKLS